jgi:hypothetical protein
MEEPMSWKDALELYVAVGRLPGVLTPEERALMARAQAQLMTQCHSCLGRLPLPRAELDRVLAVGAWLARCQAAGVASGQPVPPRT